MDNQITIAYFKGITELPYTLSESNYDTPSGEAAAIGQSHIDMLITEYQAEFLNRLFGSEVIPETVKTLVNNEAIFRSPIADFVFCNAIHEFQQQATVTGEQKHSAQNSISASYVEKYLYIWNRLVKSCLAIRKKLYDEGLHSTYPTDINDEIYSYKSFI